MTPTDTDTETDHDVQFSALADALADAIEAHAIGLEIRDVMTCLMFVGAGLLEDDDEPMGMMQ